MAIGKQAQEQNPSSHPLEHEFDSPSAAILRGAESLRQLRNHVQDIVRELDRLREANRKLADRITELEATPNLSSKFARLTFDEDKEQLLNRINSFIKVIDAYLVSEENIPE